MPTSTEYPSNEIECDLSMQFKFSMAYKLRKILYAAVSVVLGVLESEILRKTPHFAPS